MAITRTSKFLASVHRYQENLLQLAGVGPELEVANTVEKDISEINSWLEEILCTAMGDFKEVTTTYTLRGFMFQQ